jgi:hypothetical protein
MGVRHGCSCVWLLVLDQAACPVLILIAGTTSSFLLPPSSSFRVLSTPAAGSGTGCPQRSTSLILPSLALCWRMRVSTQLPLL